MNKIIVYLFGALAVAFGAAALFVLVAAFFSLPVWLLWNWVGVKVLSLPHITWLQAWGLLALSNFLFKSSGSSSSKS